MIRLFSRHLLRDPAHGEVVRFYFRPWVPQLLADFISRLFLCSEYIDGMGKVHVEPKLVDDFFEHSIKE